MSKVQGVTARLEAQFIMARAMSEATPQQVMQQMITGFWISRAIYSAAKYGLADLLKDQARTVDELAAASGTQPASLYRLLRALASVGIFAEDGDGRFRSTPLAATLESDAPGSLRYFAMAELGQEHYSAWEEFPYSLETGDIAFVHRFGKEVWAYYAEHSDHAEVFNNAMTKVTELVNASVLDSYPFTRFRRVVDVGGGHGELLISILKTSPEARGVLFDSPQVIAGAKRIAEVGLTARCELVAGDFFHSVPLDGDAYVLKWIIHDWNDEHCVTILKNIRRSIARNGVVLIVDAVIPNGNEPFFGKLMDLNMLVMTGGRERTEEEFKQLLAAAGFRLLRIVPTLSGFSVIEAASEVS
jgi:ubiquinone/menaquinone biosynthesis C-methylase UbiE